MRCPYLGLESDRSQALPQATSLHRCYKVLADRSGRPGRPERVAIGYQAQVCLGQAHFRCPRLALDQPLSGRASPVAEARGRAPLRAAAASPAFTRTAPAAAAAVGGRRPVSVTELVVMGLGVSLLFACLFVGLALIYRLQVGPGMSAAPALAVGPNLPPTLVPTFTPTAIAMPVPHGSAGPTAPPTPAPAATAPPAPPPTAPPGRPPAASPPTRLVIPKIDLDIPVLPVGTKTTWVGGQSQTVWADVPNAGGFHQTSAYPGNPGNTVINGHRDILGAVFRRLDRVQVGDDITLYVGDVAYPYRVAEILVVPEVFASASQRAENQRLIGYMPEERLTLVTCTPVALATHRLLVIASPLLP